MTGYPAPVDQLLHLGVPSETRDRLSYATLGLGPEHIPDLIRLATDRDLVSAEFESLEASAVVHAWRALGELRAEEAVEPLIGIMDFIFENDCNDDLYGELPAALAMIGPGKFAVLARCLEDPARNLYTRATVTDALEQIALNWPDTREECVALLTRTLAAAADNDPVLNGSIIARLVSLKATESAPVIEAAFADDSVEWFFTGSWENVRYELGLGPRPEPRLVWTTLHSDFRAVGDVYHADPAHAAKRRVKEKARRKLVKKSRKLNRKRR